VDSNGTVTRTAGVLHAGNTSPSITVVPAAREFDPVGGFWIAFQGVDGYLWRLTPGGSSGWAGNGLGVAAGTSPSIASAGKNSWKIAFHAAGTDELWTVDLANTITNTHAVLHTGATSPSITSVVNSGYWIAYVGPEGYLRRMSPTDTGSGWALGVAPGTSPSIAADDFGGWQIAFHAQGDHLWTIDSAAHAVDEGPDALLAAGTSPALVIAQL
jgi:hypothetical protein